MGRKQGFRLSLPLRSWDNLPMRHSNRVILFYTALTVIVGFAILLRFGSLMLTARDSEEVQQPKQPQIVRGSIYDRNGRLLANQIKLKSLEAWLPSMKDLQRSTAILAPILGLQQSELLRRFTETNRNYLWVKRFLSESETRSVRGHIERGDLPGLLLRDEYRRYYPLGELGSHLLGFTNIDSIGLAGVERSMESWLNPKDSNFQMAQQNSRQVIYGNKVFLSIDIDTQYIIDKIVRKTMITTGADSIVALLMDARTGALVAYVCLPEYDPNLFNYYPAKALHNQAIAVAYEPGSVFKIYTMAAMLDLGVISVDNIFDITTTYNPPIFQRNRIRPISDVTPHGPLSATEVLIYSSNVGMATAAEGIRSDDFYNKLRLFGFGSTTGIQLPGESNGILKSPSSWSLRTKPTISFGQEIGVSAIQMITAATPFTNGGMLLAPIIIDRIEEPDGNVRIQNTRQPKYEVISPVTAQNMLMMMEQVVASDLGTMRDSRVEGLRISGKSGTAQVIDPQTGEYDKDRVNSSAIAIFPTNDPRFILYVNIFNPRSRIRYGGRLISPMVTEAISELTTHYNLPLKGNRIAYFNEDISHIVEEGNKSIQKSKISADIQTLPDFSGLSKRELLPLLRIPGLSVQILGDGHVVRQSQPPGTAIPQPVDSGSLGAPGILPAGATANLEQTAPETQNPEAQNSATPNDLEADSPQGPQTLALTIWLE